MSHKVYSFESINCELYAPIRTDFIVESPSRAIQVNTLLLLWLLEDRVYDQCAVRTLCPDTCVTVFGFILDHHGPLTNLRAALRTGT